MAVSDSAQAVLKVKGLDHVVLRVRDLTASLAFYRDILGLPSEREVEALGLVQLRAGGALIDLVPVDSELGKRLGDGPVYDPKAGGRNMDHFALMLEDFDEAAIRAHLAAHNVEAGETGERYGAEGYGPSIYLTDPDGNTVELKGPATRGLNDGG